MSVVGYRLSFFFASCTCLSTVTNLFSNTETCVYFIEALFAYMCGCRKDKMEALEELLVAIRLTSDSALYHCLEIFILASVGENNNFQAIISDLYRQRIPHNDYHGKFFFFDFPHLQ